MPDADEAQPPFFHIRCRTFLFIPLMSFICIGVFIRHSSADIYKIYIYIVRERKALSDSAAFSIYIVSRAGSFDRGRGTVTFGRVLSGASSWSRTANVFAFHPIKYYIHEFFCLLVFLLTMAAFSALALNFFKNFTKKAFFIVVFFFVFFLKRNSQTLVF